MRARRTALVTLLVAAAIALIGACSAVQESLECPGADCPESLQEVVDAAAAVPDVTAVDRAWRFSSIEKGHHGGVQVRAAVTTEAAARKVAVAVAEEYRASEVDAVEQISVRVVPDPEASEPATQEGTLGTGPTGSDEVACAPDGCATEVAAFERGFADDDLAGEADLGEVSWVADDFRPYTSIEVTASGGTLDDDEFDDLRERILDLAAETGLTEVGQIRTAIHFNRRVEFTFSFPGDRAE